MTSADTPQVGGAAAQARSPAVSTKDVFAEGVARLAGILLSLLAFFQLIEGIATIANSDSVAESANETFGLDAAAAGWVHLVVGVLGLAAAIAIITAHTLGYLAGIGIAFLSAVTHFFFIPYFPAWSLLVLAFNVLVIWALCTSLGRDRVGADHFREG
jgi:hypothetical protein